MSAPERIPVAVLGASGYAGGELVRLLLGHPGVELVLAGANESAGRRLVEVHPHLGSMPDAEAIVLEGLEAGPVSERAQAAFLCLPHGMSSKLAPELLEAGVRVIDLAGDFRLPAPSYPEWYGFDHPAPEWLDKSVYGLTELFREQLAGATLVANPGCYPTPVVLGLAPLLSAGLIEPAPISVDGKSGVSGAGKGPSDATAHAATEESVRPYRFPKHQHTPEMEHGLELATGVGGVEIAFVPHLVPAVRGVLTTSFGQAAPGVTTESLTDCLEAAYASEPFVRVLAPGEMVDTKRARGSNVVELQAAADPRTGTVVVAGALDNLVKGAAGQAVQNLNVAAGLEESLGLALGGIYP